MRSASLPGAIARVLLRADYVAVAVISAAVGWHGRQAYPTDFSLFADAGRHIWHLQFGQVYADRIVQAGPLQLAGLAAVGMLFGAHSVAVLHVAGSVAMALGLAGLVRLVRSHLGLVPHRGLELAIVAAACLWGWVGHAPALGHPAEALLPATWVLAAVAMREHRPLCAGAALGLGTGLETWALIGLVVIWLGRSGEERLRALAVVAAIGAALWAPFVLSGHFAMTEMRWPVTPGSVVAAITGHGQFTAGMRALQLASALTVGSAAARLLGRSGHALWAVPLAATAVRLVFDPVQLSYYWIAPMLLGFVAVGTVTRLRSQESVLVGGIAYAQVLAFGGVGTPVKLVLMLITLLLLAALVRRSRAAMPATADSPAPGPSQPSCGRNDAVAALEPAG